MNNNKVNSETIALIKSLNGDVRNGSALIELMDYYNKSRLCDITQEEAEIFYILYENIHQKS